MRDSGGKQETQSAERLKKNIRIISIIGKNRKFLVETENWSAVQKIMNNPDNIKKNRKYWPIHRQQAKECDWRPKEGDIAIS